MKRKQSYFKNFLVFLIVVLCLIGIFNFNKGYEKSVEQKIAQQKEQEPEFLASAKPEFEAELANVIPPVLQTTLAPYGNDFVVRYRQDLGHNHEFDGYAFSRVFRVTDSSVENIKQQIVAHLESNGYSVNRSDRYISTVIVVDSSPRGFKPDIKLIPFENEGYIDVQVELYRNH